jgi:predicted histidine transporter YuiF (NhaC family)
MSLNTSPSSDLASIYTVEPINNILPQMSSNIVGGTINEYLTMRNILIVIGLLLTIYLIYCFIHKYNNKTVSTKEDVEDNTNNEENNNMNNNMNNNVMYERRVRFADQQ